MDERVRNAVASKGFNRAQITILDALLKLRQVCCDPALVKTKAAQSITESAKRERLQELLQELLAEGRKVLVFSQFTSMLDLIAEDLNKLGIDYPSYPQVAFCNAAGHGAVNLVATDQCAFQRGDDHEIPQRFLTIMGLARTGIA